MPDRLTFVGSGGETVAGLEIWSAEKGPPDAVAAGESEIQLCEQRAYEYRLIGSGLRLRCPLARRSERAEPGEDFGRIETGPFVGNLRLEVVREEAPDRPVGATFVTVRSEKLDYRTHYRGMLRYLADRFEALAVEARNANRVSWRSDFRERARDRGWVQLQLEFLRQILDDPEFAAAVERVVRYPHERLARETVRTKVDRLSRIPPGVVRQLASGSLRRPVPADSPLARFGLATVAAEVDVDRKARSTDTPENRFVRDALRDFVRFLDDAGRGMTGEGWAHVRAEAERLRQGLEEVLARPFFADLGESASAPFGSPVLQRRAGYREIYRTWLRFHTSAHISWSAGEDLFAAGQRDVASLYEYWLFFVLLEWFKKACGARFHLDDLFEMGSLDLRLRKGVQLGPLATEIAPSGRRLKATFSFNHLFRPNPDSAVRGTWTRSLRPDYTFTFWPAELTPDEAERLELLVHVHFDAKYRVEGAETLFGREDELADETAEDDPRRYRRQDLLKMHAYRDAIRRSEGAYILFPGDGPRVFRGYQEILPGLGAFGIRPDADGRPEGLDGLDRFLRDLMDHLGRRGTARERVRYHRYGAYVRELPAAYRLEPSVNRVLDPTGEPLPPVSETVVLVAWVRDEAQLADVRRGKYYVRLGRRRGSVRLTPKLAAATKVLLRGEGRVYPGLYAIAEPGIQVMTRRDLAAAGFGRWVEEETDDDHIYGVFDVAPDPDYAGSEWDPAVLNERLEAYERERRGGEFAGLGRSSPIARILTLDYLLPALSRSGAG